ncbi:MAG: DUF4442 domain-containing protein [Flavobacteriales bacterium]|nr:DUF4442 domain-containing protein [Flavobacteriales bacterium]
MSDQLLKTMKRRLWLMGWVKIPLIAYTQPRLVSINDEQVEVSLKLRRRTRNHLKSMYFGALAIAADVCGGIHAFYYAEKLNCQVSFAFKSMHAEFMQRAESDCLFTCKDGLKVKAAMQESLQSGERINEKVCVQVSNSNHEPVAAFEMEISVKCK